MYPVEGRAVHSVPGSSKLVTPNEPPVGPVFRPQSTPAWVNTPSPTRKEEKNSEVEAERLWWSDACERQAKELQSAFSTEFSRLADRLTRDIAGCEQKLEQLVANESNQRAHALAEIRREADSQGTELSELIRSQQDFKDQLSSLQASLWLRPGAEADFEQLQKEVQETRHLLQTQPRPVAEVPADATPQNMKVQQLEATLIDLRRDMVGCVDSQEQVEKLLQSLQRDCTEMQEKVRLQSQASEEQRSLHQVISQSAGDLGRGIEEVSTAMLQAESNLRQEIQKADRELRAELVEEVETRFKQLAQSLTDERDSRLRESGILKTRVDSACNRLEQLEPSSTTQEMSEIKMSLQETKNDLTELQSALGLLAAECRRTAAGSPTAANQDSEIQQVSDAALRLRVEALEAQADSQVPRSLQLESQVKDLRGAMSPMGNRVQALEAELRKWDRDTTTARLNAAEAEITRLGRDNNFMEGLRADVEVLKRKLVREPTAAERLPRLVGRQLIPEELRQRVAVLEKNVHDTVAQTLPGDIEGTVRSDSASAPSAGARSGEAEMEQLAQLLQGEDELAGNHQLIAAIQALREKNSALRENNAELAQEVLVHDVQHVQLPRATWQPGEPLQGLQGLQGLQTYRSAMGDPANPVAVVQGGTVQVPPNQPGGGSVLMMPGGTMPAAGMPISGSVLIGRGSVQVGPGGAPRTNSPRREKSKEQTGNVVRSVTPLARFKEQAQHVRGASPERARVVVTGVPPGAVPMQQPMSGWLPKHG